MKTMKRLIALLMVASMAFSLVACDKKPVETNSAEYFDENGNYH